MRSLGIVTFRSFLGHGKCRTIGINNGAQGRSLSWLNLFELDGNSRKRTLSSPTSGVLTTEVREKRMGLLPSVSQQVQLGGTLLGNPRTALEWGDLEFTGGGAEWGANEDVERYFPDGTAVGDRVRKGSPSQPKGHAAVRITAVPVATAWQVERRDFSLD